jgi:ribosomal protein S18 acetylase RimI-like enzyme
MIWIRNGESGDIEPVRRLLHETWHDTYDALIGPRKVEEITASWHSPEVLVRGIGHPQSVFLVAEDAEGHLVGHLFAESDGEGGATLLRLYVLPGEQRRGAGSELLSALFIRLPECRTVRLEVESQNEKARRFYEKHGFAVVGRAECCGGDTDVPSLVMQKQLLS